MVHDSLHRVFIFIISLCVVAFGQPAKVPWLCPFSAAIGIALFLSLFTPLSNRPLSSRKERFWTAAAWFSGVQLLQLSWMTSIEYQGYYILFVYLILAALLGLQFGLITALLPKKPLRWLHIFSLSALWTILEWSRTCFYAAFHGIR